MLFHCSLINHFLGRLIEQYKRLCSVDFVLALSVDIGGLLDVRMNVLYLIIYSDTNRNWEIQAPRSNATGLLCKSRIIVSWVR